MLLRHAGYLVEEAYSCHEAVAVAHSDTISLVLICHTVPDGEKAAIIAAVQAQQPLVPILCISDHDYYQPPAETCRVVSSAPAELLAAVSSVASVSLHTR